jgi:hypothetical protein
MIRRGIGEGTFTPEELALLPAIQFSSWLTSTSFGSIPNWMLAGGVLIAILAFGDKK